MDVIDRWTGAEPMQGLVEAFGGRFETGWTLHDRIAFLAEFSSRWDFRGGVERLEMAGRELSGTLADLVSESAAELGLTVVQQPAQSTYRAAVVLGGVALSCKLRTELAGQLVGSGRVEVGLIALLGAARPIPASEREAADQFAAGASTEFDMLNSAAEKVFGLSEGYSEDTHTDENPNLTSVIRRYKNGTARVTSFCAPSSDPSRRPNTDDAYSFFGSAGGLRAGDAVLICSSQIYVPFHLFGAIRTLAIPFDVTVDVIGYPLEWASGPQALRRPENLLQETRSAILAAERLYRLLR